MVTWISLAIIAGCFLFFLVELFKVIKQLRKSIDSLDKSLNDENYSSVFGELWTDYKATFVSYEFGNKTNEYASEYFNTTLLLRDKKWHYLLSSASSILVGLGILGTFIGLTVGIDGFETETSEAIKGGIQDLLAGMATAFWTSIAGMGLSIVFTSIEKYQIGNLQSKLQHVCFEIDNKYRFNKDDEQKLKESETRALYDRYFAFRDENGNMISMANLLYKNYMATNEMSGAMSSFSTDLAIKIEAGFDSILNSQSLQEILPTLNALKTEIIKLGRDLQSPASDMVGQVVEELKKAFAGMIVDMQKSVSSATSENLTTITELLASSSQALIELPRSLAQMTKDLNSSFDQMKVNLNSSFDQVGRSLQEISVMSVNQSKEEISNLQDAVRNTLLSSQEHVKTNQEAHQRTYDKQQESIKELNELVIEFQETIKRMSSVNSEVSSTIQRTTELQADVLDSCNTLAGFSDVIKRSSDNFLISQTKFKDYTSEFIDKNSELLEDLEALVVKAIRSTSENIDKYSVINSGITQIFEKIKEGLEQYQRTINANVESSLKSFTDSLTEATKSLSGAAEEQRDLLEDLTDIVSKIKR